MPQLLINASPSLKIEAVSSSLDHRVGTVKSSSDASLASYACARGRKELQKEGNQLKGEEFLPLERVREILKKVSFRKCALLVGAYYYGSVFREMPDFMNSI